MVRPLMGEDWRNLRIDQQPSQRELQRIKRQTNTAFQSAVASPTLELNSSVNHTAPKEKAREARASRANEAAWMLTVAIRARRNLRKKSRFSIPSPVPLRNLGWRSIRCLRREVRVADRSTRNASDCCQIHRGGLECLFPPEWYPNGFPGAGRFENNRRPSRLGWIQG